MRLDHIQSEFVEFIPKMLQPGVLYISERYKTASHLCACGCGEKVVTPLSPVDWKLQKDAGLISLHPSIGNWNYACKSHYWIRRNKIVWAGGMSDKKIAEIQARDLADKARYVVQTNRRKRRLGNPTTRKGLMWVFDSVLETWHTFKRWLFG